VLQIGGFCTNNRSQDESETGSMLAVSQGLIVGQRRYTHESDLVLTGDICCVSGFALSLSPVEGRVVLRINGRSVAGLFPDCIFSGRYDVSHHIFTGREIRYRRHISITGFSDVPKCFN
jgi:hypothetical protein